MKSIKAIRIGVILSIVMLSCRDHGNRVRINSVDKINYQLTLIPKELMLTDSSTVKSMADLVYFKMIITEEKGSSRLQTLFQPANYNKLLFYINSSITKDFVAKGGEECLNPVQVYFEPNNKISNSIVFMLAFEKFRSTSENLVVQFDDNIFQNGLISFKYKANELNSL